MALLHHSNSGLLSDIPYHEETVPKPEPIRQRGRLSKPLTNTSATNGPSLLSQLSTRRKSLGRSTYSESPPPSLTSSREALRSHLFDSTSNLKQRNPAPKQSAVALIISKYERNASQPAQATAPSTAPQRPLSNIVSTLRPLEPRKPSVSSFGSDDKVDFADLSAVSADLSAESSASDLAPPSRRASFVPGAATRGPYVVPENFTGRRDSMPGAVIKITNEGSADAVADRHTSNDWVLPPRIDRVSTPADLDYTHLGNLTLGSLHVVNGRTSPTPTDVLFQLKNMAPNKLRRNASSVYESDFGTLKSRGTVQSRLAVESEWEDDEVVDVDPVQSTDASSSDIHRAFSFKPGSEAKFNKRMEAIEAAKSAQDDTASTPTRASRDQTAMMAEAYMAELATSPYASTEEEESSQTSSQNSIIVHPCNDAADDPFIDETLAASPVESRHESPISFLSALGTETSREDKFVSAVELQPQSTSRLSRDESIKTQSTKSGSSLIIQNSAKYDSGYSSTTSFHAFVPPDQISHRELKQGSPNRERKLELRFPFRKAVQNGNGVVVRPTPLTSIPVPTSAEVEQASATVSNASPQSHSTSRNPFKMFSSSQPSSPAKSPEKQRKKLVKQRRKSTANVSKEPVIRRLSSLESTNIPPVSNTARQSLAMRSKAVPELERTYRTQNSETFANQSVLSLSLPKENLRFPSPEPEQKRFRRQSITRSLSKSRPVVSHRPKSWFGWQKDDSSSKRKSGETEANNINVDDLGSVIKSLGDNPYDMTYGMQQTRSPRQDLSKARVSPSGVTSEHQSRSMMDDQTASKLSKARRRSMTEKGGNKRNSFDDRGGIPGKMPHPARLSVDAPPLPPLPTAEEINKRLSIKHSLLVYPDMSHFQEVSPEDSASFAEPSEPPPPPPPSHSPRPQYIDHSDEAVEDLPPPPPSHSPRPMDITSELDGDDQDAWSTHANSWRERRMSASEALKRTWQEDYSSQDRPHSRQAEAATQIEYALHTIPGKLLRSSTQPDEHAWHHADHYQEGQMQEAYNQANFPYSRQPPLQVQHDAFQYTDYDGQPQHDPHAFTSNLFHNGHVSSPFHYHHNDNRQHQRYYFPGNSHPHSRAQSRSRSRSNSRPGSRSDSQPRSQQNYAQEFYPDHRQHAYAYSHSASSTPRPHRHSAAIPYNYNRGPGGYRPPPQANMYSSNGNSPRYHEQRPAMNGSPNPRDWLDVDSYGSDPVYPKRTAMAAHASGGRAVFT